MQTCKICNMSFFQLRPHLKKHKMTWQEYQKEFNIKPDGFIIPAKSEQERINDAAHRESVWRARRA